MNLSTSSSKFYALTFIGVFVSTLVLLVVLSEIFLRVVVVPSSNFYKQLDYYNKITSVSVAVFGDSHMSQGFYSEDEEVANFAFAGESFEQIATKVDYFLKNKKADNIILQVEHHMFADYRFDKDRRDYDKFFSRNKTYLGDLYLLDPVLRKKLLKYWAVFIVSKGRMSNKSEFTSNGSVMIDYVMPYPPTSAQKQYRYKRFMEHSLKENYRDRATWDILRRTIKNIKAKNINLCIISFPVTPFYKEAIDDVEYTKEANDRIAKISKEEDIKYLSYRDLYDGRYEYFRNLDHLNSVGAKKFTKRLLGDCL